MKFCSYSKFLLVKIILFILYLQSNFNSNVYSLELRLTSYNKLIIFKDGQLNPLFNFSSVQRDDCTYNQIFFEVTDNDEKYDENFFKSTSISINKNDTEIFNPLKLYISNNSTEAYYVYNHTQPSELNSTLEIFHQCSLNTDIIPKNDYSHKAEFFSIVSPSDNWAVIKFEFFYNNQTYFFEFIKICKNDSLLLKSLTILTLLLLAVFITFISTYEEIKSTIINEAREQSEIKWWHGLVFISIASVFLILIFYFINYLNVIYTWLVTFQSFICVYTTLCHFLKRKYTITSGDKFNNISSNFSEFLKHEIYEIKIFKIISFLFSVILIYSWYVSRNWILNNTISFCLVFVLLSIIYIKNFKICMIILLCVFVYDSFWVFFSEQIFKKNVMVTVATSLNLPIKLELPFFFINNPVKSCILLGLGDLVLPGIIIKYCRNFDKLKNTDNNNESNYYFKAGMILYIISLILAFIVAFVFNHAQPVLFYICPIFILGLIAISCYKHDLSDFLRGKNLAGTQIAVDEIINGEFTRLENNSSQAVENSSDGTIRKVEA